MKKFEDGLPMLCDPSVDRRASRCSIPRTIWASTFRWRCPTPRRSPSPTDSLDADYYVIALVQTREQMSSALPAGTLLREYVQLETPANTTWSKHVQLQTALPNGTYVPTLMPDGSQAVAVDNPHFLGPVIAATKNKPVRIVFYNLLPKGSGGDLFLPLDTTSWARAGPATDVAPR